MGFLEATKSFFTRYVDFSGRSSRSEYWWAYLGVLIIFIAIILLSVLLGETVGTIIITVAYLSIIIPTIAIGVRRLHDLDKSGWFYLLALVPIVSLILLVWFCTKGTAGPNRFGADPLGSDTSVFN